MFRLRPHQLKAVDLLRPGSILIGGVGSGKSAASLAYFFQKCGGVIHADGSLSQEALPEPMNLVIITTAKKRNSGDWGLEAGKFGFNRDPGLSLSGVRYIVDSWNNISKYADIPEYEPNIGDMNGATSDIAGLDSGDLRRDRRTFFILDEQRVVGKGAWVKSFLKIAGRHPFILLSATPADTWMDLVPVFIANGFYRNRTEFYENHVVWHPYTKYPKVERYVNTAKLERLKRQIMVDMPLMRHTTRHTKWRICEYDRVLYDRVVKDRWHVFEERPIRDIAELISVARRVVNSDPSRIDILRELVQDHSRVIVFYNFDYELEILREAFGGGSDLDFAEYNGHKHEAVPETEAWVYAVQYLAGAEAWNCVSTDTMVFYSLNYSYRLMEQARGRIDRLNTPYRDLLYYNLRSMSSVDAAILKALREKRTFNERDFDG